MNLLKPKVNVPEPPKPAPTIDEAAQASDYADRLRRRRGRASTIKVSDPTAAASPAAAAVLGG